MLVRFFLLTLLTLISAGCATSRGFNRGELRQQMNGPMSINDGDIAKALSRKAQLPKPFKVGIYFEDPSSHGGSSGTKWRWSGEDKNKILSLADKMKATGEISQVFTISDSVVSGTDLKALRLAAAQHGADALLVVSGVKDLDSYYNNWGWTYLAIVPALFVPATVNESLFMARATMWDVRNEFLYMTAEAESTKTQTKPAAFADERKVTEEAKEEALDKLRDEISKMIISATAKFAAAKK